ncbi:MAG TPA: sulfite exporter TauE/SafE family protein [Candidatus Binatia bacterium]
MEQYLWLVPLGFVIGAYGTLIGAGGGFVLVPLLLLAYPSASSDTITSISLAVVFFNALSGSIAYARARRIDYYSGVLFALATVPGAILGALTTAYIPRRFFDVLVGFFMLGAAVFLFCRPAGEKPARQPRLGEFKRRVVEADGTEHIFHYNRALGVGLSLVVGFLSSLLGIGGGFIHVTVLVGLLNFPVHIATATSHFVLSIMALSGTLTHIMTGAFQQGGVRRTIMLSLGVVLGAQLGACLSSRIRGDWIIRGLALALALVGMRLLWTAI